MYFVRATARLAADHPHLAKTTAHQPTKNLWPNFLKKDNLLNVLKQISVVAIIAIGMTMVIVGGIDLSVGGLIAAGVIAALQSLPLAGDGSPTTSHLLLGSLAGIAACALVGLGTGGLVTLLTSPLSS